MRGTLGTVLRSVTAVAATAFERSSRRKGRSLLLDAVTTCVQEWGWPVVPGAGVLHGHGMGHSMGHGMGLGHGAGAGGGELPCGCPRPDCPTPGAHPYDPPLLAATTDSRMVGWWWRRRPDAPIVVATGGAVSAVSLPIEAGVRALEYFDTLRVETGPVIATPTRCVLLVAPYTMQELAELLIAQEWVPTSLRFHGSGGYVLLPPSRSGAGALRWLREEPTTGEAPWLPTVSTLIEALVSASAAAPDGARLAY